MREAIAFRIGFLITCMLAVAAPPAFGQIRAEPRAESGARSRIALPFACAYDPATGRLRMTPSTEQVYEIADKREIHRAMACNPAGVCRPWLLHRFQMQCGAHRVPWMNVVAAVLATRPGPRPTIEDGRLVLERWLLVERRLRRRCFDSLSGTQAHRRLYGDGGLGDCWHTSAPEVTSARPLRIALPPGFAPTGLISARIVLTSRQEAAAALASPPVPTAGFAPTPNGPSVPVAVEPVETNRQTTVRVETPPSAAMRSVAIDTSAASAVDEPARLREPDNHSPGPAITAPGPAAASEPAAPQRLPEPASKRDAFAEVVRGDEVAPPIPPQEVEATGSAAPSATLSLSDIAEWLEAEPYWIAGGVTLGLALLSWLMRRRERPRPKELASQRMVSLNLNGIRGPDVGAIEQLVGSAAISLAHCRDCLETLPVSMPLRQVIARELHASVERLEKLAAEPHGTADEVRRIRLRLQTITRELQRLSAIADGALSSVSGSALVPVQLVEPRDRLEAYAVLGANPDVEPRVLKKLVDALRQSWHPDQARDEADRRRREVRIKQINVAWDIIQGKRVEA